jgi:hypothetical protein
MGGSGSLGTHTHIAWFAAEVQPFVRTAQELGGPGQWAASSGRVEAVPERSRLRTPVGPPPIGVTRRVTGGSAAVGVSGVLSGGSGASDQQLSAEI